MMVQTTEADGATSQAVLASCVTPMNMNQSVNMATYAPPAVGARKPITPGLRGPRPG